MTESDIQLIEFMIQKFKKETRFQSYVVTDHSYYQYIVLIGKNRPQNIIPILLNHIINDFNWSWCDALFAIIGPEKSPVVSRKISGRVPRIQKLWIDWGKANGYL